MHVDCINLRPRRLNLKYFDHRYIDRIVISSKSFPVKYWDKFVRRKTKQKFRDQIDEEMLVTVLGEEKSVADTAFDYR